MQVFPIFQKDCEMPFVWSKPSK